MPIQGWDIMGRALRDFQLGKDPEICLIVHSDYGGVETLPVEIFFRQYQDLPELERYALDICRGRVLDVGAGAGCHSLILQERGLEVTAADISGEAVNVMKERGLKSVLQVDINKWEPTESFDTVLLLMNGIGLVENLEGLRRFLIQAGRMLEPGGQLLFDSTDFTLFPEVFDSCTALQADRDRYFGEVEYRLEYRGQLSEPYRWLFVDQQTLAQYALESGWLFQIIYEEEDQYLARLVKDKA